jgi:hypothetical protein
MIFGNSSVLGNHVTPIMVVYVDVVAVVQIFYVVLGFVAIVNN